MRRTRRSVAAIAASATVLLGVGMAAMSVTSAQAAPTNTTGGDGTSDSVMEYAAGALDGAGPIHTITGQSAGVSTPATG